MQPQARRARSLLALLVDASATPQTYSGAAIPAASFRFEAFNALNHPNWQMPTLNILSGAAQPGMPATAAHRASEFFQQRPPTCARSNWVLVFVLISIARK